MTGVSLERLADTLYPKPEPKNSTAYGTVESINPDGSYQVKLNASATTTRCAKLCDAEVTDRVLVLIQANGHCAAIGRVGGSKGASVLFYNESAGSGALTPLSESAADFEHMRIYFKKNSGNNGRSSVDLHQPNGKRADLTIFEPSMDDEVLWFSSATVSISGTSISFYDGVDGQIGASTSISPDIDIAITRVEAW